MSRRSRPPRNRKSRNPGANSDEVRRTFANDVAIAPAPPVPAEARGSGASASLAIPDADDELAELDAGWD